jgi:hypothetical protein
MQAEAPLSELDVLDWVKQKATDGHLTLSSDEDLPTTWPGLISSFTALQRRGLLNCKVHPGPSCTVTLPTVGNSDTALSGQTPIPSPQAFAPNRQTLQRLKQYGFGTGQIADLLVSYQQLCSDCTDEGFAGFCLHADKSVIESLTTLQSQWNPSNETTLELNKLGVPDAIQAEYLEKYRQEFGDQRVYISDWNEHFLIRARSKWSCDNRNGQASEGTFMCAGWTPSDETMAQLESEGMDRHWLDTLAMEFRLYWDEVGAKRVSWNNQFIWWARRQWPKEESKRGAGSLPGPALAITSGSSFE